MTNRLFQGSKKSKPYKSVARNVTRLKPTCMVGTSQTRKSPSPEPVTKKKSQGVKAAA